ADVEGQSGAGDLYAYVQIRARREVTDPGLVAALEFPGHAYDRPPSRVRVRRARLTAKTDIGRSGRRPGTKRVPRRAVRSPPVLRHVPCAPGTCGSGSAAPARSR